MLKTLTSAIATAALTICVTGAASAATTDHWTKFTFNQPITVPGVTLPAGTYVFKLADPTIERKVVQVLDERATHSYAMILTVPVSRQDNRGDSALTLMETVEGMPAAIQNWFPIGEYNGFEFIYSKDQRARLTGTATTDFKNDLEAAASSREVTSEAGAAAVVEAPDSPSLQAQAQPVVGEPAQAPIANEQSSTRESLPATATSTMLVALIGAFTLFGGAYALGKARV